MDIKQTQLFSFTHHYNGNNYSFNIAAETRDEAAKILSQVLKTFLEEMNAILYNKAGTKAS